MKNTPSSPQPGRVEKLSRAAAIAIGLIVPSMTGAAIAAESTSTPTLAAETAIPAPVLVDRWGIEHGWSVDLTTFGEGHAKAYAVVFLDTHCPVVTRLAPTLNALQEKYLDAKVQVVGVYSNNGTTRLAMASHAQKLDFSFPVFLDVGGRLARTLKARATPEAFLLDESLAVRYRGMVDDAGFKKTPVKVGTPYLANAIDGLLANKVVLAETRALGCQMQLPPLKRPSTGQNLTYYRDVGPIINQHCVTCHYPGGIGGFPLHDFASVQRKASTILREVEYQRMPPWQADDTRGRPVHGSQALSDHDRNLIVDWITAGMGDRGDEENPQLNMGVAPPEGLALPPIPREGVFSIGGGKPDYVLTMAKPFLMKASQTVEYQYFWVPNDFKEDRYVQELELLPGDRRVVHHMQVFLIEKKHRPKDTSKPLTGAWMMGMLNGFTGASAWRIASYTPGDQYSTRRFASDEGIHIPAGYDAVFEMHYTPADVDVYDRSAIGFVWRKEAAPPEKLLVDHLFYRDRSIEISPHRGHVRTEFQPYFKQNVVLVDVRPHMHLRGADYQLTAIYPDGREELLVAIPAYDFNWQRRYVFKEPVKLPAGSTLRVVGHWDNSRLNPNNPDPSHTVIFGEESADEMSNLVVTYRVDTEAEAQAPRKVISTIAK